MARKDGRGSCELRKMAIEPGYLEFAAGSALVAFGSTRVICSASVAEEVPHWMKAQKVPGGWLTAEYQMLPGSTADRNRREIGHVGGRTHEIQRLIGRSLRAAVDLEKLGPRTIFIDCDVIGADGGTRCASITGGMVALSLAIGKLLSSGKLKESPILCNVAAVSVGVHQGEVLLDLCYEEDSAAEVDMNVVMTDKGGFVELQATAEDRTFTHAQLEKMMKAAGAGLEKIFKMQKKFTAVR